MKSKINPNAEFINYLVQKRRLPLQRIKIENIILALFQVAQGIKYNIRNKIQCSFFIWENESPFYLYKQMENFKNKNIVSIQCLLLEFKSNM